MAHRKKVVKTKDNEMKELTNGKLTEKQKGLNAHVRSRQRSLKQRFY